jgi:hypothetical protein
LPDDGQQQACDRARFFTGQKQDHGRKIFRRDPFGEIRVRHFPSIRRRVDDRREHRVHDHSTTLQFFRQAFRETHNASLRGAVRPHACAGFQCARRTDIDDPPITAGKRCGKAALLAVTAVFETQ